jgi:hypothetical protein
MLFNITGGGSSQVLRRDYSESELEVRKVSPVALFSKSKIGTLPNMIISEQMIP